MTPECVQEEYGIPTAAGASFDSKAAVTGFIGKHFDHADLAVSSDEDSLDP